MSDRRKLPEALKAAAETPSVNPRYRGANPNDLARALLGKKPRPDSDVADDLGAYAAHPERKDR